MSKFNEPKATVDLSNGELKGLNVIKSEKVLKDLKEIFEDEITFKKMNPNTLVYKVQINAQEKEGKEGGLFFGTSCVYPGKVGDEYFMTKGHFHLKSDTSEYYWCIEGKGMLILMDEGRNCYVEKMFKGSLHYIPGKVAHRIANTGEKILTVGACWPSDAGHDYVSIMKRGFSARLKDVNCVPTLIYVKE